jgi:thiamine-monophosphate kinase
VRLKKVGEFPLIDIISKQTNTSHPSVIKGIGDDAAVIAENSDRCLLITTDILRENIHFKKSFTTPYLLGKKCLSVNLSDIAAMGGTPFCYFVSISVPPEISLNFIKELYRGMHQRAKEFNTILLGGDTVSSLEDIVISITLIGKAKKKSVVYRNNAKKGDLVYMTGYPGESALGLLMLKKDRGSFKRRSAVKKHLDPCPRIEAGKHLAEKHLANSMIDISDGLFADLGHITRQSKKGARIYLSKIPLSNTYKKECLKFSKDIYNPALFGGEDYELLFTSTAHNKIKIKNLSKKLGIPITCIGEITEAPKDIIILDSSNKKMEIKNSGYRHF